MPIFLHIYDSPEVYSTNKIDKSTLFVNVFSMKNSLPFPNLAVKHARISQNKRLRSLAVQVEKWDCWQVNVLLIVSFKRLSVRLEMTERLE